MPGQGSRGPAEGAEVRAGACPARSRAARLDPEPELPWCDFKPARMARCRLVVGSDPGPAPARPDPESRRRRDRIPACVARRGAGPGRTGAGCTVCAVGAGAVRVTVGCALVLVLAACGQPDNPARSESGQPEAVTLTPGPDGAQSVEVDAGDDFRFHPSVINARARAGPTDPQARRQGRRRTTGRPHNCPARACR